MARSISEALLDKQLAAAARYNVNAWAALLNLPPRTLRYHCQQKLQCPPEKVLKKYRLEDSQAPLLAGHPVKQVAADLWYKQASLFCRQFKDHFKLTPKEFVAQHQVTGNLAATDNTLPPQITH